MAGPRAICFIFYFFYKTYTSINMYNTSHTCCPFLIIILGLALSRIRRWLFPPSTRPTYERDHYTYWNWLRKAKLFRSQSAYHNMSKTARKWVPVYIAMVVNGPLPTPLQEGCIRCCSSVVLMFGSCATVYGSVVDW